MHVYIFHSVLNQNATKDMFCTDQAGTGKLLFNNLTNTSIDRQKSIGGKDWLAPLGSPKEVDNCLCRRMLTLEKTLEFTISRAFPPYLADELKTAVKIDSPHNSWVACVKDEINKSVALWHTNSELSFSLCTRVSCCPKQVREAF